MPAEDNWNAVGSVAVAPAPVTQPAAPAPETTSYVNPWLPMYSGLNNLDDRVTPEAKAGFNALDRVSKSPQEDRAASINQTFIQSKVGLSSPVVQNNWPAIKDAFAKEKLGLDQNNISDTQLYNHIGQKMQEQHQMIQDGAAGQPWKWSDLGLDWKLTKITAQAFMNASMKPIHTLPAAPKDLPNIPWLGMGNPALAGGIWNAIKPQIDGMMTPLGLVTLRAGPLIADAAKAYPAAKDAVGLMSAVFTGLMAKAAHESAKQVHGVLSDPKSTLEDKVSAVGEPVADGLAAMIGGLGLVFDVMPEKAKAIGEQMKDKTPAQVADVLRDEAAKTPVPSERAVLQEAAGHMERADPEKAPEVPEQEKITNAAIRTPDGKLYEDVSHDAAAKAISGEPPAGTEEGFVTTNGRFVDREEAARIAKESSQLTPEGADEDPESLHSHQVVLPAPSDPIGIVAPGTQQAGAIASGIGNRAVAITRELYDTPRYTPYKQIVNEWRGNTDLSARQHLQEGTAIAERAGAEKTIGDRANPWPWLKKNSQADTTLSGMYLYREAGGDEAVLKDWLKKSTLGSTKDQLKAALNLNPEQKAEVGRVGKLLDDKFDEAVSWGIFSEEQRQKNYAPHFPVGEDFDLGQGDRISRPGLVRNSIQFQRRRVFPNVVEGELAGTRYQTKNLARAWAQYASEVDKAIETKKAIKRLTTMTAPDGRPLAAPFGAAKISEGVGTDSPTFIKSMAKGQDFSDYRADIQALRKWKWLGEDAKGTPLMMEGILGLHPDIARDMSNVLGRSKISEWLRAPSESAIVQTAKQGVKGFEWLQKETKETMLGYFSPFHLRRISEQAALGYHINVLDLPEMDPKDAEVQEFARHSGMIGGTNLQMQDFIDGLGQGGSVQKLLPYGQQAQDFSNWLFHEYIPRVGFKAYQALKESNIRTFKQDYLDKKVSLDDIKYLSARQANQITGYPNYADYGRNPTVQHILRLTTLAPAFWEQNLRWLGTGVKGFIGAKAGRQSAKGLAYLAATQYIGARILNSAMNDGDSKPEEPFGLVVNNKVYSLRTLPVDIFNLTKDWRQFAKGRGSPLLDSGLEMATQTNYRGERVSSMEAAKEFALRGVPITLRAMPGVRDMTATTGSQNTVNWWQQALATTGFNVSRRSAINNAYELARSWSKGQGVPVEAGKYPVSKYQQLRYALEDGDLEKASQEIKKLKADDPKAAKNLEEKVHASISHPWTGSKENDEKLFKSLGPEDRWKLAQANQERQVMLAEFTALLYGHFNDAEKIEQKAQQKSRTSQRKPETTLRP